MHYMKASDAPHFCMATSPPILNTRPCPLPSQPLHAEQVEGAGKNADDEGSFGVYERSTSTDRHQPGQDPVVELEPAQPS